ncbi:MAG: cupin domain-containing protein [Polyangiaceae bacterium]
MPQCAGISGFANAPGSGLPVHHDRFDQLLFHVRGEKLFRFAKNDWLQNPDVQFSPYTAAAMGFGPNYQDGFPGSSDELFERAHFETTTLQPGSCFFMPAGTWHTTAEQTGDCLSLVVVVRAPSKLALLLNLIENYGAQSPELRARCYAGFGDDGAAREQEQAELQRLLHDLGTRLTTLPAAGAYAGYVANCYSNGTTSSYPHTLRFERYIRLPNSTIQLETDAALGKLRCLVEAGPTHRPPVQTVLAFNPEARPIVDWVVDTKRAFSVTEASEHFSEFEREDIEDLFAWLAQAGLIRPLTAPPWRS